MTFLESIPSTESGSTYLEPLDFDAECFHFLSEMVCEILNLCSVVPARLLLLSSLLEYCWEKIVLYIVSDHNSILGTSITILKPCHAFLQSSSIILLYKNLQGWEILTVQPGVSSFLQTTLIEQL